MYICIIIILDNIVLDEINGNVGKKLTHLQYTLTFQSGKTT